MLSVFAPAENALKKVVSDGPAALPDSAVWVDLFNPTMEEDRAVVVVTHDARVFEFGDRIAHMEDGQIVRVTQQTPVDREQVALANSAFHVTKDRVS